MEKADFFRRYTELGEMPKEITLQSTLRVNTLKISDELLVERLKKKGILLKRLPYLAHGYEIIKQKFSVGAAIEYLLGYYYLHEAASQLAVQVLDPTPEERVLDMAAAPGGKTTQLGMVMGNTGVVIACDKGRKIESLKNNLERMGVHNVLVYKKDARFVKDFGIAFDKVLLDVPCSGNFAVDEDWFSKRKIEDFEANAQLQKELIEAGLKVLKKGGELVYSTCSLEPEENELVINSFLEDGQVEIMDIECLGDPGLLEVFGKQLHPDIKKCRRLWPWKTNTQGFFIAKLKKC